MSRDMAFHSGQIPHAKARRRIDGLRQLHGAHQNDLIRYTERGPETKDSEAPLWSLEKSFLRFLVASHCSVPINRTSPPRKLYPRLNVRTDQPRLGLRKIRGIADDIRWIMPNPICAGDIHTIGSFTEHARLHASRACGQNGLALCLKDCNARSWSGHRVVTAPQPRKSF